MHTGTVFIVSNKRYLCKKYIQFMQIKSSGLYMVTLFYCTCR